MLQIVPMEERDREAAVLRETPGADAEARVLVMTDGADELGLVVAGVRERTLVVYGFSVAGRTDFTAEMPDAETVFILDTLLRSAASFGEVNGADRIRTTFPDFYDFFRLRGFEAAESHMEAPMSAIVHYT